MASVGSCPGSSPPFPPPCVATILNFAFLLILDLRYFCHTYALPNNITILVFDFKKGVMMYIIFWDFFLSFLLLRVVRIVAGHWDPFIFTAVSYFTV